MASGDEAGRPNAGIGDELWVERCKWPDRPHYGTRGVLLGEDEHGHWVGYRAQSPIHRGDMVLFLSQHPVVVCVSHADWYMASWWSGHEIELYVDVVTPPAWTERGATMVDLDFDIIVIDGESRLVDEDEFEEHRVLYGYPEHLITAARTAAMEVFERVRTGQAPFTPEHGARWHERLVELTA